MQKLLEVQLKIRAAIGDSDYGSELDRMILETRASLEGKPVAGRPEPPRDLACSFCDARRTDVKKLIAGPTLYICDRCVVEAAAVMPPELPSVTR